MPILDAVWDPIVGKVVYRDLTTNGTATTPPTENVDNHHRSSNTVDRPLTDRNDDNPKPKQKPSNALKVTTNNRRRSRTMKDIDKKPIWLDWRTTDDATTPTRRDDDDDDRIGPTGISPSKFHQSDKKDPLPSHQLEATIQLLRKEQTYERRAFKEITCYKSFPLQEQALRFCQSVQNEWDPLYRLNMECPGNSHGGAIVEAPSLSSAASASSNSGGSTSTSVSLSSLTPEPKRQIRAPNMSPNECTMMQQFRNQFIQTRSVPSKSIRPSLYTTGTTATTPQQQQPLGAALYCLEPRIFAIESKQSKPRFASGIDHKASSSISISNVGGGRRRYVAAHVGRFMDTYWCKTEPEWRHAYELIPPHTPCRLYLDIECVDHPALIHSSTFSASSLSVSELQEQLLQELYEELATELKERYGNERFHCPTTNCTYELRPLQRQDIVDLDSSTATKFSRHWIVHIPVVSVNDDIQIRSEVLFPDNAAVGTFTRQWVGRMAEQHATGQLEQAHERGVLQKYLFVRKQTNLTKNSTNIDQMSCLIDLGVYTKNRLFRLMGSMKYGKPITAAFRIADTNDFPFRNGFGNDSFYVPAMEQQNKDTICDNSNQPASFSSSTSAIKKSLSRTDWSSHSDALAQTFVVPINVAKIDYPLLPRVAGSPDKTRSRIYKLVSSLQQKPMGSVSSFEKSPYPMIDEFVQHHLANRGGTPGMIRTWSMEVDPTTSKPIIISYQMCHNRYCECVGREHKSNNIVWNCSIISMECYQTCHDPDCRALNFRGQSIPLPANVQDELRDALFEEDLARLDITDHPPTLDVTQQQQATMIADEYDEESSFDEALAALNIDDLGPPVSSDHTTTQVGISDACAATLISYREVESYTSDPNSTRRCSHASEKECDARSTLSERNDDDDDDDDDSYSDLYRLALEIDAKKEIQRECSFGER